MKKILSSLAFILVIASCAPSTPQTRIQENPGAFQKLTTRDQSLVQEGKLRQGMTPAAVELAWGKPSARYEGSNSGKITERWDYTGTKPVYTNSFYGNYGFGYGGYYGPYGRYGRHYYPYSSFGFGPEVVYAPYKKASVLFRDNRVDSWESVR